MSWRPLSVHVYPEGQLYLAEKQNELNMDANGCERMIMNETEGLTYVEQ